MIPVLVIWRVNGIALTGFGTPTGVDANYFAYLSVVLFVFLRVAAADWTRVGVESNSCEAHLHFVEVPRCRGVTRHQSLYQLQVEVVESRDIPTTDGTGQ
jgi:hypothetical protein